MSTGHVKKILLVEDDQLLRDLYHELLTDEGFLVDQAADGETGLQRILQGGYNLILLDIMLPKRDGIAILKEVKDKKPAAPNGPIVLLTNLGQDALIKEGFAQGAAGYLIKSALTPDQVLHEVRTFLAKASN